jgi:hypothetical protein
MDVGKMMSDPKDEMVRPTIDEIEALLNSDDEIELDILPNGEIRASKSKEKVAPFKVLTMRENLGGEYAGHKPLWP